MQDTRYTRHIKPLDELSSQLAGPILFILCIGLAAFFGYTWGAQEPTRPPGPSCFEDSLYP